MGLSLPIIDNKRNRALSQRKYLKATYSNESTMLALRARSVFLRGNNILFSAFLLYIYSGTLKMPIRKFLIFKIDKTFSKQNEFLFILYHKIDTIMS